jgi:hypothetical protein
VHRRDARRLVSRLRSRLARDPNPRAERLPPTDRAQRRRRVLRAQRVHRRSRVAQSPSNELGRAARARERDAPRDVVVHHGARVDAIIDDSASRSATRRRAV